MDRLTGMSRKKSELDTREGRAVWASRVKDLRAARGMHQHEVAELAAISRTTLIDIEAGRLVPQTGTLRRILDVFAVSPDGAPEFSEDTEKWLAVLGALLDAVPEDRRGTAAQAAVAAVTDELTRDVRTITDDDFDFETNPPKMGDLRLAAKRGTRKKDA